MVQFWQGKEFESVEESMKQVYKHILFTLWAIALLSLSACGPKYKTKSEPPPVPVERSEPVTYGDGTIPGTPGDSDPLDSSAGIWESGGSAQHLSQ